MANEFSIPNDELVVRIFQADERQAPGDHVFDLTGEHRVGDSKFRLPLRFNPAPLQEARHPVHLHVTQSMHELADDMQAGRPLDGIVGPSGGERWARILAALREGVEWDAEGLEPGHTALVAGDVLGDDDGIEATIRNLQERGVTVLGGLAFFSYGAAENVVGEEAEVASVLNMLETAQILVDHELVPHNFAEVAAASLTPLEDSLVSSLSPPPHLSGS